MAIYMYEDPAADWSAYCADRDRETEKYPVCDMCGEHITDEVMYEINGQYICEACLEECKVWVEDKVVE